MVFDNTSTWPQGDISWLWNFGDGTTSTSSKPVHTYNKSFGPNVTLYASIAGGCTDSVVIPVNIFEGPRTCDFTVNTDYAFGFRGVKMNPLNAATGVAGGQDKVEYNWIFQGGGTNKTTGVNAETQYDFQTDGVYHPEPKEFVDLMMDVIFEKKIENRVIIQSFDIRTLHYLHQKHPDIKTALLVEDFDKKEFLKQIEDLGFVPTIYSPAQNLVTPKLVKECKSKKVKLIPWTVNNISSINKYTFQCL
jgi:hypothetical protein